MPLYDKIDGDLLVNAAMQQMQNVDGQDCGLMFMPTHGFKIIEQWVGTYRTPAGLTVPPSMYFKFDEWQKPHAHSLTWKLNYDLHHDGAWSCLWRDPNQFGIPVTLDIAFQDKDGDVQFVIEGEEMRILELRLHGPDAHMENCEAAYQEWRGWEKDVDIQPDQKIAASKGQKQKDPFDQPDPLG